MNITIITFRTINSTYRFTYLRGHHYGQLECVTGTYAGHNWTIHAEEIRDLVHEGESPEFEVVGRFSGRKSTYQITQIQEVTRRDLSFPMPGQVQVPELVPVPGQVRVIPQPAPERVYKGYGPGCSPTNHVGSCVCDLPPTCKEDGCTYSAQGGPSHNGSRMCKSGSIASGGTRAHCACDFCF